MAEKEMIEKCDGLLCMSKNSSNFAAHFRSVVNETDLNMDIQRRNRYIQGNNIYTGNK